MMLRGMGTPMVEWRNPVSISCEISVLIAMTSPRLALAGTLMSARAIDRKSTRLNSSHTDIYTLSLHDALPICGVAEPGLHLVRDQRLDRYDLAAPGLGRNVDECARHRSEEHTSELQSHRYLHAFPTRRSSNLWSGRTRSPSRARSAS